GKDGDRPGGAPRDLPRGRGARGAPRLRRPALPLAPLVLRRPRSRRRRAEPLPAVPLLREALREGVARSSECAARRAEPERQRGRRSAGLLFDRGAPANISYSDVFSGTPYALYVCSVSNTSLPARRRVEREARPGSPPRACTRGSPSAGLPKTTANKEEGIP